MLEEMRIQGLGVIEDAVLELSPGLTVVTGETGAGKTMVVTGLGLLFGGRADPGAVRLGAATASVEGRLRVDPEGLVAARAIDAGAELDDDVLLLARSVSGAGRSRAHLGGRGVPAALLAELAESCVAVHGQSDQSRLLQPSRQREALDRYAGAPVLRPLAAYRSAFDELKEVTAELDELVLQARERAQEAERLRFGLEDVERVDPQPGETVALRIEEDRLGSADLLRGAAARARAALLGTEDGDEAPGAATLAADAASALEQVGVQDPALDALRSRVREISYLAIDVGGDLAAYVAGIETDPTRLASVQERRAELARAVRTYGAAGLAHAHHAAVARGDRHGDEHGDGHGDGHDGRTAGQEDGDGSSGTAVGIDPQTDEASAVLAWAQDAATRLTGLEGDDDRVAGLRARRTLLAAALAATAAKVSTARGAAGARLAKAVSGELAALAMASAGIEVRVSQTEVEPAAESALQVGERWVARSRHGVDDVELLLRPHAGAPARALQKGASGGELSRVMLAVEVVLAGIDPVPTLVFDEVDAGVGGKAAVEVGRRLAALSRSAQVIVVTHLPQVAAFADQHLVVRKAEDGAVTRSGVVALDESGRLRELSRMLAGQEDSATAEAHARELLAAAAGERSSQG